MGKKVRDIMTPDPVGVYFDQSIKHAARVMRDFGLGSVIVVDSQSLTGIVTDRDLVVRGVAESLSPDAPVGPLASGRVIGVSADEDVARAEQLMRENAIRRLPVVDKGQIAGVVSLGDLARNG